MAFLSGLLLMQLLSTVFVIIILTYIYFRYFLYNYWKKKGVSYVEPTIPVGNLWRTMTGKTSVGELYADAYAKQKRNNYFGMYVIYKPCLVIVDPNLIKFILTKEFNHFHDRGIYSNPKVDPLTSQLFLISGSKWRNLRSKLTPTFTSGKIKQMFSNVIDCGENLTEYLKPKAKNREMIDMKDLIARYSTDVIMSTAFGINCNSVEDPNTIFRFWGRKIFQSRCIKNALATFAPKIMDLFSIPLNDVDITNFFMKTFNDTVRYRETNNVSRPDFMNLIMQLMRRGYVDGDDGKKPRIKEKTGQKISMSDGAAQAFVFFFAGFETSSSTVTFCLYELARNQDLQEKVMKEIDKVLEKFGSLTYESLQEMPYLHKVISEAMRMYPSLPVLNRMCTKDIELPTTNFVLKKGVHVVIPVLGIHRDPEIYPEPDKFDPERFDPENVATRHEYTYLPFGEGPRICIGMRFGYIVTKVGVVSILSKYRVRFGPNTPDPVKLNPGSQLLTSIFSLSYDKITFLFRPI